MRKSRILSFVLLFCIICSTIFGTAHASDILTLDEMDIDPWGDLEEIQGWDSSAPPDDLPIQGVGAFGSPMIEPMAVGDTFQLTNSMAIEWGLSGLSPYGIATAGRSVSSVGTSDGSLHQGHITTSVTSKVMFLRLDPGYLDIVWACNYPRSEYDSIDLVGTFDSSIFVNPNYAGQPLMHNPTRAQLLVNGEPWDTLVSKSGARSFDVDISFDLDRYTGDVFSLGWRVYFDQANLYKTVTNETNRVNFYFQYDNNNLQVGSDMGTGGWFRQLFVWLANIRDGILNIGSAIASLPGKIADLIIAGIKSLFLPSESDITKLKDQYHELFSQRLGFIYQIFERVIDFATRLVEAVRIAEDYQFVFPGISVPIGGENKVLLPPTPVSFDNPAFLYMRPFAGTAVSFVCVVAFVNTARDMVIALISGVSYFDFIKRKGSDGG